MGSNAREGIVGDFNGLVGLNLLGKPLKGFGAEPRNPLRPLAFPFPRRDSSVTCALARGFRQISLISSCDWHQKTPRSVGYHNAAEFVAVVLNLEARVVAF
jgi:hypothetical protein